MARLYQFRYYQYHSSDLAIKMANSIIHYKQAFKVILKKKFNGETNRLITGTAVNALFDGVRDNYSIFRNLHAINCKVSFA
jgi:hypothetical protein